MKRRNYLAAIGSVAAGSALTMGTTASIDVWANRDANVSVVTDSNGLIGLAEGGENGRFASTEGDVLGIDLSDGGAGDGISVDSRVVIDDIFRIQNQAGDNQVVWIKDVEDDGGLFGDEGPLHFFRGPVRTTSTVNGDLGNRRRVFSQLDPVPGTRNSYQRLTITGLVPAQANIGPDPTATQRKAWINQGHPVTVVKGGEPAITDAERRNRNQPAGAIGPNVFLDKGVVVGEKEGRYFLTPGEEMKVGLAADFAGFDASTEDFDLGQVLDEIEVVSRSPEDARSLATGDTEFNPIQ